MVKRIDEKELSTQERGLAINKAYEIMRAKKLEAQAQDGEGEHWLWTAIIPEHGFIVDDVLGRRTRSECRQLVKSVSDKLDTTGNVLFITDGLDTYETSLKERFATKVYTHRVVRKSKYEKKNGRVTEKIPKEVELPDNIHYAKVVKHRNSLGRLTEIECLLVFGKEKIIRKILNQPKGKLSFTTNAIERLNLSRRTRIAKLQRKTIRYAKDLDLLRYHLILERMHHNFCWTPKPLREKLTTPEINPETGKPRKYRYKTPAMSIGITNKIWSLYDLLTYKA